MVSELPFALVFDLCNAGMSLKNFFDENVKRIRQAEIITQTKSDKNRG